MAALEARSTLANQGISRVMEATSPGYYRAVGGENRQKLWKQASDLDILLTVTPRVKLYKFLSICFIDNRPKGKQIKWVKSDPVSAAFFLEIPTLLVRKTAILASEGV